MPEKTPKTAVVIVPPNRLWGPIQAIRKKHDRSVKRWMPHFTLIYPFRPRHEFERLATALAAVCETIDPFDVTLEQFRIFVGGRDSYTVWLAPEPPGPVIHLQDVLWRVAPDCDDTRRYDGGFTPHLSVGQVRGEKAMGRLCESLQKKWRPLSFTVDAVSLIWRNDPPDDVFRVDRTVPLGAGKGKGAPPSSRAGA